MKILNPNHLPQSLVDACDVEPHSKKGCISATELLRGTKQNILTRRHWEELEDTVDNRVWQIFGTAVHAIFEKQDNNSFKEESFSMKIGSLTVTGKVDNYDMENEILADFKTCSQWKIKFNDFEDWRKQGLVYAYLMKHDGLNVKKCQFVALIKDHSKTSAKVDPDYPKTPIFVYEFDVTEKDLREIEIFINDKVLQIVDNENKPDDEVPCCTGEERWEDETKWKVKKEGRKTAVKVCSTEAEALNYITDNFGNNKDYYVEEVKGESKRCSGYCLCNKFCNFYKEMLKEKENGSID